MQWFQEFISKNSVALIITVSTLMMTLFARVIIKVFRLGVTFKTELATKKEMIDFKQEIRSDLINYKEEVSKILITTITNMINEKTKNLEKLTDMIHELEKVKVVMEEKMRNMDIRLEEYSTMVETVKILSNKISIIEGKEMLNTRREDN